MFLITIPFFLKMCLKRLSRSLHLLLASYIFDCKLMHFFLLDLTSSNFRGKLDIFSFCEMCRNGVVVVVPFGTQSVIY